MDKYDYHFISIKFLTAILLALIFAFLLIYVFTPQQREDYSVYSLQNSVFQFEKRAVVFDSDSQIIGERMAAEKSNFEAESKARSFELMEQTKNSMLSVITANHLEKMNGLRELRMLSLDAKKQDLEEKEESLLQERRQELETELSQKLQQLRQRVRDKYSDFNQQQIRANYLGIINLNLKIEFIARNQAEKEKYQEQLEELRSEQETIMAEKNLQLNEDISSQTSELIMEFNQQYSAYRDQIRNQHQKIISEENAQIEDELAQARRETKNNLTAARQQKREQMEQLIEKTKKYY
jgi:hypothetical protein